MYDYTAGKSDWFAMDMPGEGSLANATVRQLVREVPQCRLEDDPASLKSTVSNDWEFCVVVDPAKVVLGLVELSQIADTKASIEEIMKPAPLTFRPSVLIDEAIADFAQADRSYALVTKSTGELIGAIRKSDLETHRHEPHN